MADQLIKKARMVCKRLEEELPQLHLVHGGPADQEGEDGVQEVGGGAAPAACGAQHHQENPEADQRGISVSFQECGGGVSARVFAENAKIWRQGF